MESSEYAWLFTSQSLYALKKRVFRFDKLEQEAEARLRCDRIWVAVVTQNRLILQICFNLSSERASAEWQGRSHCCVPG